MRRRFATDHLLKNLTFALLALMVGAQIIVWRPLFADGAFLLMRILDTRTFHDTNEPSRIFDYWFTQFPLVAAISLGVTNLHILTYIFASWMIVCFMMFWGLALWVLRKDFLFWPFLALFLIAYFNGGFFTVGEYNLDYALTALCFALMLRRRENSPAIYVLLLFAAALSVLTYASTMFLGIVLVAVALIKLRRESRPKMKVYWLSLTAIFLISVAIGWWGYLYPNHELNKARAIYAIVVLYDRQFWVPVIVTALTALQLLIPSRTTREIIFLIMMAIAVIALTGIFLPPPTLDFAVRAYTGMVLCGGFAVLAAFRFGGYRWLLSLRQLAEFDPVRHCAIPVFALLVALSFFDFQRSKDFGPYLDSFREQVNSHTGILPWEASMATVPNDRVFGWSWTYPSMSLVLRRDAKAAIISNARANTEEQPFDPARPPDLSHYYPNNAD
jgi:hypothetical protein